MTRTSFVCQECGATHPRWLGRCPDCMAWSSLVEEAAVVPPRNGRPPSPDGGLPVPLSDVPAEDSPRVRTGIDELDRVLGGGLVPGSAVLVGGDPGIGKSTLVLQAADRIARQTGRPVLYVTGEESARQVKMRAERVGVRGDGVLIATETDLGRIGRDADGASPALLVVDSIQTVHDPDMGGAPGSVGQVRECAAALVARAKRTGVPTIIIGHVTKDGAVAGPRVLEHVVDAVLYLEGDRASIHRLLRSVKNRYGAVDELGVFRMGEEGLVEVPDPSEVFLTRDGLPGPGSVTTATNEGTRTFLVEVQALVGREAAGSPTRRTSGVDPNRAAMLLAVLERRVGLSLCALDVFVNAVGGVRLVDPACDLAIASAVASAHRDLPILPDTVVVGEVGLGGEVRRVGRLGPRMREAARLGFRRFVCPPPGDGDSPPPPGIEVASVRNLSEAIEAAMG